MLVISTTRQLEEDNSHISQKRVGYLVSYPGLQSKTKTKEKQKQKTKVKQNKIKLY